MEKIYMNNTKMITIFSQKLAGYLMFRGFVLVDMDENRNQAGKHVFYFNDSADLQAAITDYKQM